MTETLSSALPPDIETLVQRVLKETAARGLKLATAESCTGGLLASALTDVDGYGSVFDRGFVVYSAGAKRDLLDVPEQVLADPGPVSEPAARAMAEGALRRSEADIALAVTGFTGPAGPDDTPGLVHFATARRGRATHHRMERFGPLGRGEGRLKSLRVALAMLRDAVTGEEGEAPARDPQARD